MNQQQQFAIDYLREENRVLREQLGGRRVRLNDDQRRRLAAKAKNLTVEEYKAQMQADRQAKEQERKAEADKKLADAAAEVRRKREPRTRATSHGR